MLASAHSVALSFIHLNLSALHILHQSHFALFSYSLFVSGVWGCRDRSVLLTPAVPRPPVRPQRRGGRGKERTEVPVSARLPPRWRQSSNWEECPTQWAPLFSTLLLINYSQSQSQMLKVMCVWLLLPFVMSVSNVWIHSFSGRTRHQSSPD